MPNTTCIIPAYFTTVIGYRSVHMFFLVLLSMLLYSCGSVEDELARNIRQAINDDQRVSQNEMENLQAFVNEHSEELEIYMDRAALCDHIQQVASARKGRSRQEVDSKTTPLEIEGCGNTGLDTLSDLSFNVYLENSASMDGYMNGRTQFKEALYHILTRINGAGADINFSFINKESYKLDNKEIQDFIDYLQPSNLRKYGSRGNTELNDIVRIVLDQYKRDRQPAVLISDYIFSVKNMKSVDGGLASAKYTLMLEFQEVAEDDIAVLVVQNTSEFDGTYYDFNNKRHQYKGSRPYYIWIFGPTALMQTFFEDYFIERAKGYQNFFLIMKNQEARPYYSVLPRTKRVGRFNPCRDGSKRGRCIERIDFDGRRKEGTLEFAVAVDLSEVPVTESYKSQTENYLVSSYKEGEFEVAEVLPITAIEQNDESRRGAATHILVLSTHEDRLSNRDQTIEVKMRNTIPTWVENKSTLDDSGITSTNELSDKTFGFEYLISGVFEAFHPDVENTFYWSIPIDVMNE